MMFDIALTLAFAGEDRRSFSVDFEPITHSAPELASRKSIFTPPKLPIPRGDAVPRVALVEPTPTTVQAPAEIWKWYEHPTDPTLRIYATNRNGVLVYTHYQRKYEYLSNYVTPACYTGTCPRR